MGSVSISQLTIIKLFLSGILVSAIIGIIAGLLPAYSISKKNIVESLRYE